MRNRRPVLPQIRLREIPHNRIYVHDTVMLSRYSIGRVCPGQGSFVWSLHSGVYLGRGYRWTVGPGIGTLSGLAVIGVGGTWLRARMDNAAVRLARPDPAAGVGCGADPDGARRTYPGPSHQ